MSLLKIWITKIKDLCSICFVAANKCSLVINYEQLLPVQIQIARWMIKSPRLILETFEDAAKNVVLNLHPNYKNVHQSIYVRITNLRKCVSIRNIRYLWNNHSHFFTLPLGNQFYFSGYCPSFLMILISILFPNL